jgi:hypothetical protein
MRSVNGMQRTKATSADIDYGWMPHNASFGFLDLTPSILLLRQFWD